MKDVTPTLPPITIMLWEYQISLLIRALMKYQPANEDETNDSKELIEILQTILYNNLNNE